MSQKSRKAGLKSRHLDYSLDPDTKFDAENYGFVFNTGYKFSDAEDQPLIESSLRTRIDPSVMMINLDTKITVILP